MSNEILTDLPDLLAVRMQILEFVRAREEGAGDVHRLDVHTFERRLDLLLDDGAARRRCKPQCDRRASFGHGKSGGHLSCVPHDAGTAAITIIHEYYSKALRAMRQA